MISPSSAASPSSSTSTSSTLIRGGLLVTMNPQREVKIADIRFTNGVICQIAENIRPQPDDQIVEAANTFVIPGLIQVHTHLCQALFRGIADDLELLDWLQKRIWPLENAHTPESLRASAQIGLLEMQLLGTTSILDMGTVRHHDVVFEEAELSGMRYWGGNCLMDLKAGAGPLYLSTTESLAECERLIEKWHRKTSLLQYVLSPRFILSCTDKIMRACVKLHQRHHLLMHTHASENKTELKLVRKRSGMNNVAYLHKLGFLTEKTVIAHGIYLNLSEVKDMIQTRAGLAHCPSSNLKLASGIAKIHEYLKKGMKVGLGADGAPCNNQMDPFQEMRLAALLQKPLFGPTALPAEKAFELATLGGADVLNAKTMIGSLQVGKRADVVVVKRDHPSVATVPDPYSALVYSCSGRDVRDVWVEGRAIVRNSRHQIYNAAQVIQNSQEHLSKAAARAKLETSLLFR